MKDKLLQLVHSLTQRRRERVAPNRDSPASSCCLTALTKQIAVKCADRLRAVSHRFATTGLDGKKIRTIWRNGRKDDTKNLEKLKLSSLQSSNMITLERKVTEVGEYLSKLEEDFPPKTGNSRHFSIKFKLIIDDQEKNSTQKAVLLAEIINKLSDCFEENWESFPEEVYQLIEQTIFKINELEKNEPYTIAEIDDEATKSIFMLSQSLERLKGVLQDIVQFVEINQFVKEQRNVGNDLSIEKKAKEIIKKAKTSEKSSQFLKKWLSTHLKTGYDKES